MREDILLIMYLLLLPALLGSSFRHFSERQASFFCSKKNATLMNTVTVFAF